MKCKIYIAIILFIMVLSGCLSTNDKFLMENLANNEKSSILTEKGIELYELLLETDNNFTLIPEIKRYYEIALEYDPMNSKASQYNEKLENYIAETFNEYIDKINSNREKTEKRTGNDDYLLCYYVIKAYELDPKNKEITDIRKEIRPVLDNLIAGYIEEANALTSDAALETETDKKEELIVQSLDIFQKIIGIDPENKQVSKESESAKELLVSIMDQKIEELRSRIADQYYTASLPEVNKLSDYNKKVNNVRQNEVNELQYFLYFEWAKYMYDKGDLDVAYSKVNAAIYFINKDEAYEFRNLINSKLEAYREQRNAAALKESFNDFIDQLDALIADEELAIAYQRIIGIEDTLSSSQKRQVNERKSTIIGKLEPIYQAGVQAYIEENFAEAINKFGIVVEIDSSYEDAATYLDKAKAKQALLESY